MAPSTGVAQVSAKKKRRKRKSSAAQFRKSEKENSVPGSKNQKVSISGFQA
jgi:hypothetical protein